MIHRVGRFGGCVVGAMLGAQVLGCGGGGSSAGAPAATGSLASAPRSTTASATTGATATTGTTASAAHANAPNPAAELATIGWSANMGERSAEAYRKNGDALALHRRGDFAGSLAGFEAALLLSPNYAMAHFNRACALAKLGRLPDAATELEGLLRADLYAWGPRLDADEDLAALRAAPEGARLAALRTELAAIYARASASGIPAMSFDAHTVDAGASRATLRHHQRFGFWIASASRFVPITPADDDAFGVVYSSEHGTATVLAGPWATEYYQVFPRQFSLTVVRVASPGAPIVSVDRADRVLGRLFPNARPGADEEANDPLSWPMSFARIRVRPLADGVALEATSSWDDAAVMRVDFGASGPSRGSSAHDAEPVSTVRMVEGTLVERALPSGYSITRNALTVPGAPSPFELPRGQSHRQVVVAPDSSAAFVLTVAAGCEDGGGSLRHRLARIDLHTFELRVIDEGARGAMIVRAPDGRLFVQLGDDERALAPDGTLTDAGLPAWLSIALPIAASDCSM